ncbi:hypothetical protein HYPSUDRAFT_186725 [Hypholoma sublateritium FD-334 SS-4]|uniref:Antifreeze protein n=1 Tax=Hypholoma sublateritium (strain FD-334 SS-4) TaxID=945553 RepID=A0A0D2NZX2_HYPSF|nr:hypothetical protein HYPSUDRAFT_186725 [Hypholoma sublateritium FD-334 SS-4]
MYSAGIQTLIGFFLISVTQAALLTPIVLGTAGDFTVLAKSGISTVPSSAITGNIGVSPSASTSLTGFSLVKGLTGTSATSTQVVGQVFASDFTTPTPSQLSTAVSDMQTAFTNGNGRLLPTDTNLLGGTLTSQTLAPGLYKWTSKVLVTTSLTLIGLPTDVWIFQIAGGLEFASGAKTVLAGGLAANVFWVVTGATTLQAGSVLDGVILGSSNVALVTGATVNGRILSQTAVSIEKSTVNPA